MTDGHLKSLSSAGDLSDCRNEDDLNDVVKLSFNKLSNELSKLEKDGFRIDVNFARAYIHTRVLAQLRWFGSATETAIIADESRIILLRNMFFLCVIVSIIKIMSIHYYPGSIILSISSFVSVIIFGISVGLTIDLIGQNRRSLARQYRLQYFRIVEWIEDFVERNGYFLRGGEYQGHIVSDLLAFEKIMVEELSAWLYLSRGDRLTLAP